MLINTISFWGGLGFQNLVGQTYSQLERLHDGVMVWLFVILGVVSLVRLGVFFRRKGSITPDSELLEKTWTLIPIVILLTIAFPRIRLLCLQDAICQVPSRRIKLISNQWNWQRELVETYDHLLDREGVDSSGAYEVPFLLNAGEVTRLLVTRTDVLHSIGVPAFGLKLDSVPGRLNTTSVEARFPGLYVGSCYELCGRGHRVMPINALVL